MARYNLIEIDGIYLTSTGLVGGTRCKTEVTGLTSLRPANHKLVSSASDGTPKVQFRSHKGKAVGIVMAIQEKSVFDDLIEAIDTQDVADHEAHNVVIQGDTGNFDIDYVVANVQSPGTFRNGYINEVTLDLRVHTINAITAGS